MRTETVGPQRQDRLSTIVADSFHHVNGVPVPKSGALNVDKRFAQQDSDDQGEAKKYFLGEDEYYILYTNEVRIWRDIEKNRGSPLLVWM